MVLRNLGKRIREERQRARLTQERLAELAGCNETYIGQIERGEKDPSLNIVVRIANALGVTVDFLLSDHVKVDRASGLIDELVALFKGRDPQEIRSLISMNRLVLDMLDKKPAKRK